MLTVSGGNLTLINVIFETNDTGVVIQGAPTPAPPTIALLPYTYKPYGLTTTNNEPECSICNDGPEYCAHCVNTHPEDELYPDYDDNEGYYDDCGGCGECNECIV